MVEFIIIIPVLLLLIMGILQFALVYNAKITLNYAAFETARAGSLNNASMESMQAAFARTMAALYTTQAGTDSSDSDRGIFWARKKIWEQINEERVDITLINPSPASFLDHGITIDGETQIPSDILMYRDATVVTDNSNQNIQDANLLKVHIGYCYELLVPFVNRILWTAMRYSKTDSVPTGFPDYPESRFGRPATGTFNEACIKDEYSQSGYMGIPIYAQSIIRMQSDPIQE